MNKTLTFLRWLLLIPFVGFCINSIYIYIKSFTNRNIKKWHLLIGVVVVSMTAFCVIIICAAIMGAINQFVDISEWVHLYGNQVIIFLAFYSLNLPMLIYINRVLLSNLNHQNKSLNN